MIIETIITQHAEEAAFLWLLRDAAVRAPHYSLKDLARLDERVEAHLDGLRIAGDAGWAICADALKHEESGEVFAAAVPALEANDPERMQQVCAAVEAAPETARGLISAFGWVSPDRSQDAIHDLLASASALHRRIGLAACSVQRMDPAGLLQAALDDEDPALRARALRAAGELGRTDLLPHLLRRVRDEDAACRFRAAWSALLLGDRGDALESLKAMAGSDSPFREKALQLALRAMDGARARDWLKGLAQYPDWLRYVVLGAGIAGDPAYIPWLMEQMETPELARPAGESFSMITGVDLAYEDLDGEWPEGFEAGPTENPEDQDVALDPDEDLPMPDPGRVRAWWQANKDRFQLGARYLAGRTISVENCRRILQAGLQRQRNAAALELALLQPGAPLFETRAPGFRQEQVLQATAQDGS
ncbi:MAG TPA: TIGR02270 family protein [Sedimenticola sp.]|nr:TIGR02270 family protein [Sedimenticola sp.]